MDEFNDDKERARKQAQEKQLLANAQRAVDILGREVSNLSNNKQAMIDDPKAFGEQCVKYVFKIMFLILCESAEYKLRFLDAMQQRANTILIYPYYFTMYEGPETHPQYFLDKHFKLWFSTIEQAHLDSCKHIPQNSIIRVDNFFDKGATSFINECRLKNEIYYKMLYLIYESQRPKTNEHKAVKAKAVAARKAKKI